MKPCPDPFRIERDHFSDARRTPQRQLNCLAKQREVRTVQKRDIAKTHVWRLDVCEGPKLHCQQRSAVAASPSGQSWRAEPCNRDPNQERQRGPYPVASNGGTCKAHGQIHRRSPLIMPRISSAACTTLTFASYER